MKHVRMEFQLFVKLSIARNASVANDASQQQMCQVRCPGALAAADVSKFVSDFFHVFLVFFGCFLAASSLRDTLKAVDQGNVLRSP